MTAVTEIRKRAIALLEQLPKESLIKAVEFLESLSQEALQVSQTPKSEASEVALIQIIQRRLSCIETVGISLCNILKMVFVSVDESLPPTVDAQTKVPVHASVTDLKAHHIHKGDRLKWLPQVLLHQQHELSVDGYVLSLV